MLESQVNVFEAFKEVEQTSLKFNHKINLSFSKSVRHILTLFKKRLHIINEMKNYLMLLQWKPLNVITLGQTKSDNINRMITITGYSVLGYVHKRRLHIL